MNQTCAHGSLSSAHLCGAKRPILCGYSPIVVVLPTFVYTPFAARSVAIAKQEKKCSCDPLESVQKILAARCKETEGYELGVDVAGSSFTAAQQGETAVKGNDGQKTKTQGRPTPPTTGVGVVSLLRAAVCASAL
jgi:hypothetical protein